ncbi:RCC1 domain-containing protein 1 [Haplosporangium bisporale]|nr:RCC1 domain-containing protein 1 [Haplosporangium bisporale]
MFVVSGLSSEAAKEKARIHGDFSPEENLIVNSLNNLSHTTSSGTDVSVKLFGWEALQGLLTASGDIIGIEAPLLTRTLFSDARDVAAGGSSCDHYTVVVDTNRQLFYWTASERIPKAFPSSSLDTAIFERVWAGEGHFLALSTNGSLYSWGSGRHGQLGHGNLKSETKPKCIESLEGIRIVDAACEFGDVYTFGLNDHGQLGIGDESESNNGSSDRHAGRNNAYPQLVDFYGTNDEHDGTPLDIKETRGAVDGESMDSLNLRRARTGQNRMMLGVSLNRMIDTLSKRLLRSMTPYTIGEM